jgi:ATP-dependent protease Clp ATPase subunit
VGDQSRREQVRNLARCSFCDKRDDEVEQLVAGPTIEIAICDECVVLCCEIIAEQRADARKNAGD